MQVADVIGELRENWGTPRPALHHGGPTPFPLRCSFQPEGAGDEEISSLEGTIPPELQDFWRLTRGGRLFEDTTYGQWGLELLSPGEAARETAALFDERADDHRPGDLVIGRFLGDSDLLIIRSAIGEPDYGSPVVALPIDSRHDWYFLGGSFLDFLRQYSQKQGEKFWERVEHSS